MEPHQGHSPSLRTFQWRLGAPADPVDPRRGERSCPLDLEPQVSPALTAALLSPALTVGPRSPRGPDFPDRPWRKEAESTSPRAWLPTPQPCPPPPLPRLPGLPSLHRLQESQEILGTPGEDKEEEYKSQEREAGKGQRSGEVEEAWREAWLCGKPLLLWGLLPPPWDPPALPACVSCHQVSWEGKEEGARTGITSPWDPGVRDSQADQEHPACPAEGQGAIRTGGATGTPPSLETPTLRGGSQPHPATCPSGPAPRLPPQGCLACKLSSPEAGILPPGVWGLKSAAQSGS